MKTCVPLLTELLNKARSPFQIPYPPPPPRPAPPLSLIMKKKGCVTIAFYIQI